MRIPLIFKKRNRIEITTDEIKRATTGETNNVYKGKISMKFIIVEFLHHCNQIRFVNLPDGFIRTLNFILGATTSNVCVSSNKS